MNTLTTEQLEIFNKAVKDAYNHGEDNEEMQDLSDCYKNVRKAILENRISEYIGPEDGKSKDDWR